MTETIEFALAGAGGEPVDLWRTLDSHGLTTLPPMRLDDETHARSLEITLPTGRGRPRTVGISGERFGPGTLTIRGPKASGATAKHLLARVRHVLRLDADLSEFYAMVADDPDLAWVTSGAGRMIQSSTVFEDVVKTICTTNCTWAATVRMVSAIVEHLGDPSPGAPKEGPWGRTFPSPAAMANAGERFYRDVARAGYRGAYLIQVARSVADGSVDLEELGSHGAGAAAGGDGEITDDEVESRLLALPGVGPYAAAHIMMTIGRYSRLILDSWTRPTYARLTGRKTVMDSTIERRFRRFGPYAGLAFWLFLTRNWVGD